MAECWRDAAAVEDWAGAERQLATLADRIRLEPVWLSAEQTDHLAALLDLHQAPAAGAVAAALRCLRAAAAVSAEHRARLAADSALLRRLQTLLRRRWQPPLLPAVRCAVQLLGNVVSAGGPAQAAVWSHIADLLSGLLRSDDDKLPLYTSMVLFNTIKHNVKVIEDLFARDDFGGIVAALLTLVAERDAEFALFCIEELAAADFAKTYQWAPAAALPLLLDITLVGVEQGRLAVSGDGAAFVSDRFMTRWAPLMKLDALALSGADTVQLKKLLELLGALSCDERHRRRLQAELALLESVVAVLRVVHELGREAGHELSTLGKLADLDAVLDSSGGDGGVSGAATFGLKAQLVRLTGNLAWRCTEAQHAVRRLHGLPVILECCNLDARNPLLQQWAVAAVRHLCEDCGENQAEISSMQLQGLDPAAEEELRTYGLTTVREAGRLRVKQAPPS